MSTSSGDVSIVGGQLYVTTTEGYAGHFAKYGSGGAAVEAVAERVGGSGIALEAQGGAYGAVSYTHLDVYKRQLFLLFLYYIHRRQSLCRCRTQLRSVWVSDHLRCV